jgi:periplasmic divalent cation tolerance protein
MILSNEYELQPFCYGTQPMKPTLVFTTVDNPELARQIATALVEAGEAACVNVIPGIRSIYRWEGKICDDGELLLIIKSSEERFEAVRTRIRRLHTYQIPEIISVPITTGDSGYLRWLLEQVTP